MSAGVTLPEFVEANKIVAVIFPPPIEVIKCECLSHKLEWGLLVQDVLSIVGIPHMG